MTTDKQVLANQQNALLSTGAITDEGKAIVSKNAVKHGIFTNDLVITQGDGKENLEEYQTTLDNLIQALQPQGQMEQLLVDKIAVDYWRLRRVIRFETGCLRKQLDTVLYSHERYNKTPQQLDEEIAENQAYIKWNIQYLEALEKGEVSFEQSRWANDRIFIDTAVELCNFLEYVVEEENNPHHLVVEYLYDKDFGELKALVKQLGYSDQDISFKLIASLKKQNKEYEQEIEDLKQKKIQFELEKDVKLMMKSVPVLDEQSEKIMRYERSIQKSIFQNLLLLKKLQASHSENGFVF